jgi:hypothetical protein
MWSETARPMMLENPPELGPDLWGGPDEYLHLVRFVRELEGEAPDVE